VGYVRLWDVRRKKEVFARKESEGWVFAVAFSPDGRTIAVGGSLGVGLRDAASGKPRPFPEGPNHRHSNAVTFGAGGKALASGGSGTTALLWDVARGRVRATLSGHARPVSSVALARGGNLLASGSEDRTVKLWDLASGKVLRTLKQGGKVRAVAFTRDGKTLAAAVDETIKLWDVATLLRK
jgi:WD40 repeat protein